MRTPSQIAMSNATRAGVLGITPGEWTSRVQALNAPDYVSKAYGGPGKFIRPDILARMQGGESQASIYGGQYEFLDRGGLGAKGSAPGFAGVAPGLQPPALTPVATGVQGPQAPGTQLSEVNTAGSRPRAPRRGTGPGFAGVQPMGSTARIRAQQAARRNPPAAGGHGIAGT